MYIEVCALQRSLSASAHTCRLVDFASHQTLNRCVVNTHQCWLRLYTLPH